MDAGAQRCAIIIDQHNVVAVESRNIRFLVLSQADQNALLLLTFDGQQHHVTDVAHTGFRVYMDYARRFTLGHCPSADIAIVDHSKSSHFTNLIANGRSVEVTGVGKTGVLNGGQQSSRQERHFRS